MKYGSGMGVAGLAFLFAALPLPAHHSTAVMYDTSKILTLQGIVTEVRWLNPHGGLFVDVKDATGATVTWDVELPSPNNLLKQGLKRNDLKHGDPVTVDVWVARDGSHRADARIVILPDGRTISGKTLWDGPLPSFNQQ
jgi:hypothetical protein